MTGYATFLEGCAVSVKSVMQKVVAISVTESEINAAVQSVQDMIYVKKVIISLGLKVSQPMNIYIDNKGAIDLINNWSVCGRTRHMDTKCLFLRELKENNIVEPVWISTKENPVDMFTKNVSTKDYNKFSQLYCGIDEYNKEKEDKEI